MGKDFWKQRTIQYHWVMSTLMAKFLMNYCYASL